MSELVDVNTATAEELGAVPVLKGHGFEIVRYRDERGGFTDLRQLDEVPGLAGKVDGGRAADGGRSLKAKFASPSITAAVRGRYASQPASFAT